MLATADDRPAPYPPTSSGRRTVVDDEDEERTSPVVWIAGIAAIVLLAAIGWIVFQMLSGPSTPPTQQVAVPEFVGKLFADATQEAEAVGLKLEITELPSDQPVGTITDQDPPAETSSPRDRRCGSPLRPVWSRCRCPTCAIRPRPSRSRRS